MVDVGIGFSFFTPAIVTGLMGVDVSIMTDKMNLDGHGGCGVNGCAWGLIAVNDIESSSLTSAYVLIGCNTAGCLPVQGNGQPPPGE